MTDSVLKYKPNSISPKTGLEESYRNRMVQTIHTNLVESYALLGDTQSVHWNIEGPLFYAVHNLTEEQYEDLFAAIDDMAERIRALGAPVPKSIIAALGERSGPQLDAGGSAESMMEFLIESNEKLAASMREAVLAADEAGDVQTADLLTERVGQHEENAWMLRAILGRR